MTDATPNSASDTPEPKPEAKPEPNVESKAESNDASAAAASATEEKKKRRWGRWAIALFALAVILRLALGWSLPSIIDQVAGAYGFRCEYDRLDLSLLGGDVELWHLRVSPADAEADATPWLDTEYCRADLAVADLLFGRITVRRLEVDGLDVILERRADGSIKWLEQIAGATSGDSAEPAEASTEENGEPIAVESVPLKPPLTINAMRAQYVHLRYIDRAVTPVLDERFDLDARLSDLGDENRDPRFAFSIATDRLFSRLQLEGRARFEETGLESDVTFHLRGLDASRLRAYLEPLGVDTRPGEIDGDGRVTVAIERPAESSEITAKVTARELALTHPLAGAQRLERALIRARVDATGPAIDEIEVENGSVMITERGGRVGFAGFEVGAGSPAMNPETIPITITARKLRALRNGDRTELTGAFTLPDIVEAAELKGNVERGEDAWRAHFELGGSEASLRALTPILAVAGLEPDLTAGALRGVVDVAVQLNPLRVDATLSELALDDGTEWWSVEKVAIEDLALGGDRALDLGALVVSGVQLQAIRDAEGNFRTAGIRTRTAALTDPSSKTAPKPEGTKPGENNNAASSDRTPATPLPILPKIRVGKIDVDRIQIALRDETVEPAVEWRVANLSAKASELTIDETPSESTLTFRTQLPGAIDTIESTVTVRSDRRSIALRGESNLRGLTDALLVRYGDLIDGALPTPQLENGSLRLATELTLEHTGSDWRIGAKATEIAWDGDLGELDLPPITARASLAGVHVGATGLSFAEDATLSGSLHAPGWLENATVTGALRGDATRGTLQLRLAAPRCPLDRIPVPEEVELTLESAELRGRVDLGWDLEPPRPASADVPEALAALPELRLDALELNIDVRDAKAAAPIGVTVRAPHAMTVLGPDPASLPPLTFAVDARVEPVIDRVRVTSEIAPFAAPPSVSLTANAEGIQGTGLTRLLPVLAESIDGRELVDGTATARFSAELRTPRRGPLHFDLSRGIDLHVEASEMAVRATPDGPIWLGLDSLVVDGASANLAEGTIRVRKIEMERPRARLVRRPEGIQALGLVVRLAATDETASAEESADGATETSTEGTSEASSTEETAVAEATAATDATSEAKATATATPPLSIRCDSVAITGLDVRVIDAAADPPVEIPLDDMDVEVRDIRWGDPTVATPMRIRAFVASAPVEALAKEGQKAPPFFADLSVQGEFEPNDLHGWVRVSLASLELPALSGVASDAGVVLEQGIFDAAIEARAHRDGALDIASRFVLTDLDLSEEPDGPISRLLKLPAPLDVVVFLLRDRRGSIELPVDVHLAAEGISMGEIARVGVSALSKLIVDAVANSPFRVVGGLTDLALGDDEEDEELEPFVVRFAPGGTSLETADRASIARALAALRSDPGSVVQLRARLSANDRTIIAGRMNPALVTRIELVGGLRAEKRALLDARAEVVREARSATAAGLPHAGDELRGELRGIDRRLGEVEEAIDRLLATAGRGADREAARRTRGACVALGEERTQIVAALLREALPEGESKRVEIVPTRGNADAAEAASVTISLRARRAE